MWIRIVWRICGDLRSTFAWFQVSRGRSDLDGSSTYFLLIFGRRPDFLDHSLAFVSRLKDVERAETWNQRLTVTERFWEVWASWFFDESAESFGFGALLPRISNGTWDLWSFCAQACVRGSLCPCFGLFCWEFGDVKTFGNHTAFICFPVGSLCRDIQPCTKVMGFAVFLKNKSSKQANGTLFLFGYGPKLAKH